MGNCSSVCAKKELEGDEKYMYGKESENVKYAKKWRNKYHWSGKLNVDECRSLVEKLEMKAAFKTGKKRKAAEKEIASAREWFDESVRRQKGMQKREDRKKEEIFSVCRQEDNETTLGVRPTPPSPAPPLFPLPQNESPELIPAVPIAASNVPVAAPDISAHPTAQTGPPPYHGLYDPAREALNAAIKTLEEIITTDPNLPSPPLTRSKAKTSSSVEPRQKHTL